MVIGPKCPFSRVFSVALDHGKVGRNVEAPGRGPPFQFRLQFGPLLLYPTSVFALVVEQKSRCLNQPLNQQDLIRRC